MYSLAISYLFPSPNSWQPLIYLHVSEVCLIWTFRKNAIKQCVAFCDWLLSLITVFSRSIHAVAHNNIPLYGYTTFYFSAPQMMDL